MKLADPANPQWANAERTAYDVSIMLGELSIRTTIAEHDPNFEDGKLLPWSTIAPYVALPPTATQLAAYARRKQAEIAGGMIKVDGVEASLDPQSLAQLNGAAALASGNPGAVFTWVGSAGGTQLTSAQILTIYGAAHGFIQNSFTTLGAVLAAIAAGTIVAYADIDNPPAPIPPWPQNS
jgi:hypothetical protein